MSNDIPALRAQVQRLQALHASGDLDDAAYNEAKAPLERQLLDSVLADPGAAVDRKHRRDAGPGPGADIGGVGVDAVATGISALSSRPGGALLALLFASIVGVAVAGYSYTGAPGATVMAGGAAAGSAPGVDGTASEEAQFAAAVEQLAQRLQSDPDNTEGHAMLARSYARLGQHEKALPAFEKAGTLLQTDAGLIVDYADTLAALNNRSLQGEPTQWIDRALKLEPDNLKALAMAGTAAFERRDFAAAARHWERLVAIVPPGSDFLPQLRANIADARRQGGLALMSGPSSPTAATTTGSAGTVTAAPGSASVPASVSVAAVEGTVRLSGSLASQVQPGDMVFIFARAADGPRMPLAIRRHEARELPLRFRLDDSTAMAPQLRLSLHPKVVITARISKSGQATPTAGDLAGQSEPVSNTARNLTIVIDEVIRN